MLVGGLTFAGCAPDASLSKYTIAAEYDPEAETLTAQMQFDYYNATDNEISVLPFNLFPNAFREGAAYEPVSSVYHSVAYYDGESYGSITVNSVSGCERWEIGG